MFKQICFVLSAAVFFCCQLACAESNLNKCTDGEEITYTDKPCEKLGLKNAGPIKDTVTIMPAPPVIQVPLGKPPETAPPKPAATDNGDVYQCTNYFGVVSYSDNPCTGSSFIPALRSYVPARQETISRKSACEKIGADAEVKSRSSVSCP